MSLLNSLQRSTRKAWENILGRYLQRSKGTLYNKINACLPCGNDSSTAVKNTIQLGYLYLELSEEQRIEFFEILLNEFNIDGHYIETLFDDYNNSDVTGRLEIQHKIINAFSPKRVKILKQFLSLPDGMKFLVDMRADLFELKKIKPELDIINQELKQIFVSWFDIGMLDLKRITWDSAASLLEKLIQYEAVHEIKSWSDLKNRLDSDRRCFAFFHYRMSAEPLIFVEVAFTQGIATNISEVLDEEAPRIDVSHADTAVFYSISNTQKGLANISFGNFLIKQVVAELIKNYKQLNNFVTLSPIPGFSKWLLQVLESDEQDITDKADISAYLKEFCDGDKEYFSTKLLQDLRSDWYCDSGLAEVLKPLLLKLCFEYLTQAKNKRGYALDPVAHFHLLNGASIHQLNWLADTSPKGIKQSFGIMVNYMYVLSKIDRNHMVYNNNKNITHNKFYV